VNTSFCMPVITRLHDHYDSKYASASFREVSGVSRVKYPRDRLQMAVHLSTMFAGERYLEIGAGNGSTMLTLLDSYRELVGTELSVVRARELRNLFADYPQVRIVENNFEEEPLPFPSEYFDTIALTAVIEHLFDPISTLRKLHRLLKPGGVVIVDTPNIAKWTRRVKLAFGYFPSTASLNEGLLCYDRKTPTDLHDEGHLHYFTFRSLRIIALERVGFRSAKGVGYGNSFLCRCWPQMFSEIAMVLCK